MKEQALPQEVAVLFKGKSVPRLTKTYIVFWNSGRAFIKGEDIVHDDQLRLEFGEESEVLNARVIKETHKPNKFAATINEQSPNVVFCNFDYLNAGDGVVLELLHTSKEQYPSIKGSIRGIPKGPSNWGNASTLKSARYSSFFDKAEKYVQILFLIVGIISIIMGLFAKTIYEFNPSLIVTNFDQSRWFLIIIGVIFTIIFSFFLWVSRRRFPKSLSIDDIE